MITEIERQQQFNGLTALLFSFENDQLRHGWETTVQWLSHIHPFRYMISENRGCKCIVQNQCVDQVGETLEMSVVVNIEELTHLSATQRARNERVTFGYEKSHQSSIANTRKCLIKIE
jgi:hypothetical protein